MDSETTAKIKRLTSTKRAKLNTLLSRKLLPVKLFCNQNSQNMSNSELSAIDIVKSSVKLSSNNKKKIKRKTSLNVNI